MSMRLDIRCRNVKLTSELRQYIERRVGQALNRFDRHIGPVWVALADVNGPKGGRDKACRVTAFLMGLDRVVITESGHDVFPVVARAATRVKQRVSSSLGRVHRFDPTRSIRTGTRF